MAIEISHLAFALGRRNMIVSMSLKLNIIYIWVFPSDDRCPTAVSPMRLLSTMITTTLIAMMINLNLFFGIIKCLQNIFPSENLTIKVLTENFCCLVTYRVFRIYHYDVFYANLKESFSDLFRVAGIYKNEFRNII